MRGQPTTPEVCGGGAAVDGALLDAAARAHADATGVGLLAVNDDGRVIGYNARLVASWELPPELESGTLIEVVDWLRSKGDEASVALGEVLSRDEREGEGDIALSDGRTIAWRRGEIPGERAFFWTFEDVSEARQAAAAMVDAANWLEILALHTDGVLVELDEGARIVGIWGAREAVFEELDSALQGKNLVEAIGPPEGAALDTCVRRVLSSGREEERDYVLEVRGARRFFSTKAMLMPTGEGRAKRATLMICDVSERARMQAQLIQSERLASIGLLAAGVAHEVNNPLGYILLNLERVQRTLVALRNGETINSEELAKSVEISLDGARRVRAIVRDLTSFCGPDEPSRVPIDIHGPLDFAIDMAEPETRQRARVLRDFGSAPNVCASESRLSQLFLNLIVNAAHAIQKGAPERNEIHVVTRTDAAGRAVVEVRDTGKGISPEEMVHIFEPFYTTKPAGAGTGLGLTICQSIVAALHGQIDVESKKGAGSVFRVLLPAPEDPHPRREAS